MKSELKSLVIFALSLLSATVAVNGEIVLRDELPPEGVYFTVNGKIEGASDAPKYLWHSDLLKHPGLIEKRIPFSVGQREADLTVLPFKHVFEALPFSGNANAVIITCKDGWTNYYTEAILEMFEPYVVLLIDGEKPDAWPVGEYMRDHLEPFYIDVSTVEYPDFFEEMEYSSMNPSGANMITGINFEEYYSPLYSGAYAEIEPESAADLGRKRFLNNCMACHKGPGSTGGEKSGRPLAVLQAHARFNEGYFRQYVDNPQAVNPASKMIPHPHLTDNEVSELIAFLSVGKM